MRRDASEDERGEDDEDDILTVARKVIRFLSRSPWTANAAAFHTYRLDHPDTKFVLDDFDRVENPRLMDEAYFDMVLEKYDELAEGESKP